MNRNKEDEAGEEQMLYRLLRFTPTRSLTYNNRWHNPVKPKHTLFFIPPDASQVLPWLDFLCTKHKRSFLFIHTIVLQATRVKVRVLTVWKGVPLQEVMLRERDYGKRTTFRTHRITKTVKRVPATVRRFLRA